LRIPYTWKVRFLKHPRGHEIWRRYRAWHGDDMGDYARLPEYIRAHAPGKSFVDIGCMWGVNGRYAFLAEEVGAASVKGVDVSPASPEFEERHARTGSSVEFIQGDLGDSSTLARVGSIDVVFCAGVLYHHPSPFDLLVALRRICRQTLILRTSTIPEMPTVPNGAVYWPMLDEEQRRLWDQKSLGLTPQIGITGPFDPQAGYGNWFWGLTPSCLMSMLRTAGFEVNYRAPEAFAQTLICHPCAEPLTVRLPGDKN